LQSLFSHSFIVMLVMLFFVALINC
jgi:hypothetical protein